MKNKFLYLIVLLAFIHNQNLTAQLIFQKIFQTQNEMYYILVYFKISCDFNRNIW